MINYYKVEWIIDDLSYSVYIFAHDEIEAIIIGKVLLQMEYPFLYHFILMNMGKYNVTLLKETYKINL